ncbi:hypothetical protein [Asticcacaulis sp. MM231]|uniref:hypothetical protein n=1 Tax=Asticcacaulis sp. MM231 TaxID=3157666 RepID=UPI0032D56D66
MTDFQTPKFPPVATPEEMKAASEKVMNFWVGALSPMWVPFWAASSFGLSAWAMTQNLAKSEGLLKDMPLAGRWPGFNGVWGAAANLQDEAVKTAEAVTEPVVEAAKEAVAEAVQAVPEPEVVLDRVIEAPVAVADAVVVEAGSLKMAAEEAVKASESAAKETVKVEPKPIAKAVSAVRKPVKKG